MFVRIFCGINLRDKVLLGRYRARDWQVVRRDKIHIHRIVEEALVKALRQDVLLRITVAAKQLRIKLEVVLRKPLGEVLNTCIGKMAEP